MASLTQNEKKLDKLFSKYIRLSNSKNEICRCYTCGAMNHWKEMDAGHYITRQHKATRWDERNVKVQCRRCNRFESGVSDEFALHLLKDYGQEVLEELNRAKWIPTKIDAFQILAMIEDYKLKIKEYETRIM